MGLSEMSADAILDAADFALLFEYLHADSPHPPALGEAAAAGEAAAVSTVNELHADARQLNAVMVAQHDGAVIQRHAIDGGHVCALHQRQLEALRLARDGGN